MESPLGQKICHGGTETQRKNKIKTLCELSVAVAKVRMAEVQDYAPGQGESQMPWNGQYPFEAALKMTDTTFDLRPAAD